jgi:hypothetical protein
MAAPAQIGFKAGGNISPSRFVESNDEFTVTQCSEAATKPPTGISPEYTRYAPGTAWDDGYVATNGKDLRVYQDGELCMLQTGNTAITGGDFLMSDAQGCGIPVTTGKYYGAQAMQSSDASGKRVQVKVVRGYLA